MTTRYRPIAGTMLQITDETHQTLERPGPVTIRTIKQRRGRRRELVLLIEAPGRSVKITTPNRRTPNPA